MAISRRSIPCVLVLVVICLGTFVNGDLDLPFFIVPSSQVPIYRGRLDPIVQPGVVSNHVHKVYGGSAFTNFPASTSNVSMYNAMLNSSCTTMAVSADKSGYWFPDLYYRYPDGNLTLVPVSDFRVYYQGRSGTNATMPTYSPFPPGFRMTAGNPFRRNNTGTIPEQALSFTCIYGTTPPMAQLPYFPSLNISCDGRLRGQVYFPSCWDGVNLDSPSHQSHVAYPIQHYDNGDCPKGFPKRLIGVFYEIDWYVAGFPNGKGYQPFVLAPGDPTGYGLHGDYLFGWNSTVFANALTDPTCIASSTGNGETLTKCKAFDGYVQSTSNEACTIDKYQSGYEALGFLRNISHVPGCDDITKVNTTYLPSLIKGTISAIPKTGSYAQPTNLNPSGLVKRVIIKSSNNAYWTSKSSFFYVTSTVPSTTALSYNGVFILTKQAAGTWTIQSEYSGDYITAQQSAYPLQANKGGWSTWETFNITYTGATGPTATGAQASIWAYANSKYVTLINNTLWATSATVVTNAKFTIYDADGTLPAGSTCQ